jgi:SAM-dependent methyltransferase
MNPSLVRFYYKYFANSRKLLDLGCGLGDMGRFKADSSTKIFGVDKDKKSVYVAKLFYDGTILIDLNWGALPFQQAIFDSILAKDILEHLGSPWTLVKEMHRIMRPGGIAVAQVPMAKSNVVWNDYTHIRGFTKTAIKKLLEDHGFEIMGIYKMGGIPLFGKFNLVGLIPFLLKIPLFDYFFGSSYLVKVRKPTNANSYICWIKSDETKK